MNIILVIQSRIFLKKWWGLFLFSQLYLFHFQMYLNTGRDCLIKLDQLLTITRLDLGSHRTNFLIWPSKLFWLEIWRIVEYFFVKPNPVKPSSKMTGTDTKIFEQFGEKDVVLSWKFTLILPFSLAGTVLSRWLWVFHW